MRIRTAKDVGLVIRERRRALGLAQRELARRLGVSRQWVSDVERGKPRADVALVLRALTALGMTIEVRGDPASPGFTDSVVSEIDAVVRNARRDTT